MAIDRWKSKDGEIKDQFEQLTIDENGRKI